MMSRKMIFFDIDGTLLTEGDHYIPDSTKRALIQARKNGHLIFINTGRTHFAITDEIKDLGFDGYVCGCGTNIFFEGNELLYNKLSHKICLDIVNKLRLYKIEGLFEARDDMYFDHTRPATGMLAELKARFGAQGYDISKSWDDPGITFDKFVVWRNDDSEFEKFYSYITEKFDYIDRGGNFGEIVPKGFSKASGIKFLQEYLDIPLSDCFAIGDSPNDLSMLNYVPNSIAMGNSSQSLFKEVAFITKDIMEDGIEFALKHYNII